MNQFSALIILSSIFISACSSSPEKPQRSWRDVANDCYAAVERGQGQSFQGRTGVAACDRYVEQSRQDEAEYNARLNAIAPLLYNNMRATQPAQQQNPRLNCTTQYLGNRAYTDCQ